MYLKPDALSMDAVKLRFKGLLAIGLLLEFTLKWLAGATFLTLGDTSPKTRRPDASIIQFWLSRVIVFDRCVAFWLLSMLGWWNVTTERSLLNAARKIRAARVR
jgi:hypothetical protein